MLPRSVEKQGLTQLVSVRPSVPKVPRSILRFYLKSFIEPSWYLPWVPEVWSGEKVAKRRESRKAARKWSSTSNSALRSLRFRRWWARRPLAFRGQSSTFRKRFVRRESWNESEKDGGREEEKRNPLLPSSFFHFFALTLTFAQ